MRDRLKVYLQISGATIAFVGLVLLGDHIGRDLRRNLPDGLLFFLAGALLLASGAGLLRYRWSGGDKGRIIICACWTGMAAALVIASAISDSPGN